MNLDCSNSCTFINHGSADLPRSGSRHGMTNSRPWWEVARAGGSSARLPYFGIVRAASRVQELWQKSLQRSCGMRVQAREGEESTDLDLTNHTFAAGYPVLRRLHWLTDGAMADRHMKRTANFLRSCPIAYYIHAPRV